jgi:hypothetical protein
VDMVDGVDMVDSGFRMFELLAFLPLHGIP